VQWAPSASPPPVSPVPGGDGTVSIGGLAPELAPLELIPEELTLEAPLLGRTTWFLLGGAALVALATLLFVVIGSAGPPPDPGPSLANMVAIEAGGARLGLSIVRMNAYLKSLPASYPALGTLDGKYLDQNELTVPVPKFWIDKYEVTNEEYLRFIRATHRPPPPTWPPGGHPGVEALQHPVRGVTRDEAEAYARWAKKKLPTVAQWMRAFHGDADTLFPWGDDFQPDRANTEENKRFKLVEPVKQTPQDVSWCGVYNLVGNVSELTRYPTRIGDVTYVIVKGGSGKRPGRFNGIGAVRSFLPLDSRDDSVGFRCVYEPPVTPSR
jgi:formylglycine-generating enzyme required for sulfatase activity